MTRGPRWREIVFLAVSLVHLVGLYLPSPPSAPGPVLDVPYLDKVVHVLLFAVVAFTGRWIGLPARLLAIALVVHAAISEPLQAWLLPDRMADPTDFLADLVGVALGLLVAAKVLRDSEPRADSAL